MKTKRVYNQRIIKYLAIHGVYPIEEYDYSAVYAASRKFFSLLERYEIERYLMPNK